MELLVAVVVVVARSFCCFCLLALFGFGFGYVWVYIGCVCVCVCASTRVSMGNFWFARVVSNTTRPRRITFNPLVILVTKAALMRTAEGMIAHTHTCACMNRCTGYLLLATLQSATPAALTPRCMENRRMCVISLPCDWPPKGLIDLIRLLSAFVWTWLIQIHTPVPLSQTITLRPLLSILCSDYRLEGKIVHGCFCCWSLPGIVLLLLLLSLAVAVAVVGVGFFFSAVSGCRWQLWLLLCFSAAAVGAILDITVLCLGASLWQIQISQIPCYWCRCPSLSFNTNVEWLLWTRLTAVNHTISKPYTHCTHTYIPASFIHIYAHTCIGTRARESMQCSLSHSLSHTHSLVDCFLEITIVFR